MSTKISILGKTVCWFYDAERLKRVKSDIARLRKRKRLTTYEESQLFDDEKNLKTYEFFVESLGNTWAEEVKSIQNTLPKFSSLVTIGVEFAYEGFVKEQSDSRFKQGKFYWFTRDLQNGSYKLIKGKYPEKDEWRIYLVLDFDEHGDDGVTVYLPLVYGMTTGCELLTTEVAAALWAHCISEERDEELRLEELNKYAVEEVKARAINNRAAEIKRARTVIEKYGLETVVGKAEKKK